MTPVAPELEKTFQAKVVELALRFGWRHWHVGDARKIVKGGIVVPDPEVAGLTDLIMVHGNRGFIFAELKRGPKEELRPKQRECLELMAPAALLCRGKVKVHAWRPDDMLGIIIPALRDGRGPAVYGF